MRRRRSYHRSSRSSTTSGSYYGRRRKYSRRRKRHVGTWQATVLWFRKLWKRRRSQLYLILAVLIGLPILARYWVASTAGEREFASADDVPECRVAIVLGAKVFSSGTPSRVLQDRLDTAITAYKLGKIDKLLMSGDNRFTHYNEPQRMADYAAAHGVKKSDIAMDFAGRRTYDTIYRAKHIFGLGRVLIVSQKSHLNRALFLSEHLGLDAYGLEAPSRDNMRAELREYPACVQAMIDAYIWHPRPVLGEKEDI